MTLLAAGPVVAVLKLRDSKLQDQQGTECSSGNAAARHGIRHVRSCLLVPLPGGHSRFYRPT